MLPTTRETLEQFIVDEGAVSKDAILAKLEGADALDIRKILGEEALQALKVLGLTTALACRLPIEQLEVFVLALKMAYRLGYYEAQQVASLEKLLS